MSEDRGARTAAQIAASKKWEAKHRQIVIRTTPQKYNSIRECALDNGISVNSLLNNLIDKEIFDKS